MRVQQPEGRAGFDVVFGGRRAKAAAGTSQRLAAGVFVIDAGFRATAAATGAVGVVRRDPMAMLPFCETI
ncbi:MAG: phosphoenolpyruvate carboxykinase domain-containing protein [Oscillospiraceae bacterium]